MANKYVKQSPKEIIKPFMNGTYIKYFNILQSHHIYKFIFKNNVLNIEKKEIIIQKIISYFDKINSFAESDHYRFIELCFLINKRIKYLGKTYFINKTNVFLELNMSNTFVFINLKKKEFLISLYLFTIPFVFGELHKNSKINSYNDELIKCFIKKINEFLPKLSSSKKVNKYPDIDKYRNRFYRFYQSKSNKNYLMQTLILTILKNLNFMHLTCLFK